MEAVETPPAAPPAWVRALDAGAVVALFLTAFVFLFGGFDLRLPGIAIRVHSTPRLLFIAAALIAIRHAAHPSVPLHRRLRTGIRGWRSSAAASAVFEAITSRAAVLAVGYFAVLTVGLNRPTVGFELSGNPLSNLPGRFDAGWYGGIALNGYSFGGTFDRQQNVAFFPAFPMLMRAAGYPIGAFAPGIGNERRMMRLLWGGVFVAIAAFAWAAWYLWRLGCDLIGEARAGPAVALLAAYPFALFYSAPYSESLFLLGSVAAIYHVRREQFAAAAAFGALAGFARPNGCFLSAVLALLVVQPFVDRARTGPRDEPAAPVRAGRLAAALLAAAAPGLAMLAFSLFVHNLTGSYFGWARLHEAWGRSYGGLAPVARAYGWITDEGLLHVMEGVPYDTLNSLGLIFALGMLWPVARRLGPAFALFILVNVVPPMLAGGVLSMGRVTATLFPLFLGLAASVHPRAVTPLVTAFAAGQGLLAVLFFTWRPLF